MPHIYGLVDPRSNEIRYIGKANNLHERLLRHLYDAATGVTTYCARWIRTCLADNAVPKLELLEEVSTENWAQREQEWITHGHNQGWRLTNLTSGGGGLIGWTPSPETRLKMSIAQKGKRLSDEHREKIACKLRLYWNDPDKRIRHLAFFTKPTYLESRKTALEKAVLASRSDDARRKRSEYRKSIWVNPNLSERTHLNNMLALAHSESAYKKMQRTLKQKYQEDAGFRSSLAKARDMSRDPEVVARMAESVRKRWQDPEYRAKQDAARERRRKSEPKGLTK